MSFFNRKIALGMSMAFVLLGSSFWVSAQDQATIQDSETLINGPAQKHGIKWGGIALDDSQFYDMPYEKCEEPSKATLIGEYKITDKVYILKTDKGYVVAEVNLSFRDLETGVRREAMQIKGDCSLRPGVELFGDIDCMGPRTVRKEPYEGCAYDIKVWAHSIQDPMEAFQQVYNHMRIQFLEYRKKCTVRPGPSSIRERMSF